MKQGLFPILLLLLTGSLFAQQAKPQTLDLKDMSAFQDQAGNWSIVGDVLIHPLIDIHDEHTPPPPPPPVEETGKKKRKNRKKEVEPQLPPPPPPPKAVVTKPGTGILINQNDDQIRDNLLTSWEHGDIILELEVMMPRGSNSGIYLQGRYEVQLLDSWGKKDPEFGDIGGIYRNWETQKGQIYMGKAPITNAAKAPGLWQHLKIGFKAPRFDSRGNKIANARFVFVDLNGVRIHENVEVPRPTGGPISKEEAAKGPIMIQGDHGPVALRNIKYTLMEEQQLAIADISFQLYETSIENPTDLDGMEADATGTQAQLSGQFSGDPGSFAAVYKGKLIAPEAGTYAVRLNYNGGVQLTIGDKTESGNYRMNGDRNLELNLQKGANPFELVYYKQEAWWPARLGFFTTSSFPVPLHSVSSFPPGGGGTAINVEPESRPRLLRAFIDFEGQRSRRLTHTIGVGTPEGVHYVYDLKAGNIACVWRGEFINATPMWNSRGDGSFRPRGAVEYLFEGLSIAHLSAETDAFPKAMNEQDGFKNRGYKIDNNTGMPIFLYALDSLEISDNIQLDESGNALQRTITLDKEPGSNVYLKLAEGKEIEALPEGIYVIDKRYYIMLDEGQKVQIREQGTTKELVGMFGGKDFKYVINW